jgi:putative transposase
LKRPEPKSKAENLLLTKELKLSHEESKGIYGAPRLTVELQSKGYVCGQNRIANLMKKEGIFGCARRKFKVPGTTYSKHHLPISSRVFKVENKEDFPLAPNRVWVGDMTYINTSEGWVFLTINLDVFNREIVGYSMADDMKTEGVWDALKGAIFQRKEALKYGEGGLICHSDQGGQYASEYYREKLKLFGITQSMSRSGNCYDNAYAESFFHTLKVELVHRYKFETRLDLRVAVQDYIEWYNTKRLHSALGYKTPLEYEGKASAA